ncbi:MAG: LysR family transcriptional regulator [Eubacteriales bacterium]|nr:LysR family transcriptional regulator [Eubacteriales bacterium]
MNLTHLKYFVVLAHTHHYTRAAEQLYITQPSLSHAIARLEEELGVPLFEKTGKNTELTAFGQQFLSCAESALKTLDDGTEMLQRGARGEGLIRLGFIRPLGVQFIPRLAEQFLKANPDREIHFTFQTEVTQKLIEELTSHHYDLVFSSRPQIESGLTSVPVRREKMVLIVPRQHPLAMYDSVDLEATLPYPYVYFAESSGLRYEVEKLFNQIGKRPQIAYETVEDEVAAGLVARNFGITVLPEIEILSSLDVKIIEIAHPIQTRDIYMVSNDRIFMPKVVQDFRDFVQQNI